jgi:poly(3-hydroxybutyrate) depolymerase
MLYTLYEAHRAFLTPIRAAAMSTRSLGSAEWAPFPIAMMTRGLDAAATVVDEVLQRRGKPEWRIASTVADGVTIPVSIETEVDMPFCRLQRFRRASDRPASKVLLVAPLSGHHATLLRGTVRGLLEEHDVWVTDWKDAARIPLSEGSFGVDDYIDYLLGFMRLLGPDLNVVAVCQPAPLVVAAVSLLAQANDPAQPATMTLMGGPVDTRAAPTVPTKLAESHSLDWFENRCIGVVPPTYPAAFRRVYPGFMQLTAFIAMNADRHINAHLRMFRHLVVGDGESADAHRRFYDEYMSVMDVPAEYYLGTLEKVFQNHDLPRGTLRWRGIPVEPRAIEKTALLTIEGELDDISAPGQTIAAHEICAGVPADRRRDHLEENVGHYGIFNGRRWRERIRPVISSFIGDMARDEARDKATDRGQVARAI